MDITIPIEVCRNKKEKQSAGSAGRRWRAQRAGWLVGDVYTGGIPLIMVLMS